MKMGEQAFADSVLIRHVLWWLFALMLSGLVARPVAFAEPYIAVREGYKCSVCHVNITGGGKRTDFANIYIQTRLPQTTVTWPAPGPGAEGPGELPSEQSLYHGNLSEYFSVGGDIRVEFSQTDTPNEDTNRQFLLSKGLLYVQMNPLPERALFYVDQEVGAAATTREMFIMFQSGGIGAYAKLGKFFLPSGLRLQDDSAYIRSATRFNYGVSDTGIEVGMEPGPFSFSLAVTNGGTQEHKKISAYGYVIGRPGLLGFSQSTEDDTPDNFRRVSNVFAGLHFGRATVLLELDRIHDSSSEAEQEAALTELNLLLLKGANLKITYEWLKPDVNVPELNRDRLSYVYEPFVTQFLQVRIGRRDLTGPREDNSLNTLQHFVELHLIF